MYKYGFKRLIEQLDYCIIKTKQEDLKDDRKVKFILQKDGVYEGFATIADIARKLDVSHPTVYRLFKKGGGVLQKTGYKVSKVGFEPVKGKKETLVQYKDGKEVATYKSQQEAAKKLGATGSQISACLSGTINSLYGYTFEWRN